MFRRRVDTKWNIVIWAIFIYKQQKLLFFNLAVQPNKYIYATWQLCYYFTGNKCTNNFMFVQIVLKNTHTPTRRTPSRMVPIGTIIVRQVHLLQQRLYTVPVSSLWVGVWLFHVYLHLYVGATAVSSSSPYAYAHISCI